MLRARQPLLNDGGGTPSITADLSATLGAATLASDATVANPITADLSSTLGAATLASDVSVASPITADLSVTLGAATLSSLVQVGAILIDDTHDGDYLKKKLKRERRAVAARRQRVLDLYEQIVEGKEPAPEVAALVEAAGIATADDIIDAPAIDLTNLLNQLERAQSLARDLAIEADDEDILVLI